MDIPNKNFTWRDEEINLLLHVVLTVLDYKVGKAGGGVGWDTVKSKYEDLTKKFLEKYPENEKDKFPQGSDATRSFNKQCIQLDSRPGLHKLCKNLHGLSVYMSPFQI